LDFIIRQVTHGAEWAVNIVRFFEMEKGMVFGNQVHVFVCNIQEVVGCAVQVNAKFKKGFELNGFCFAVQQVVGSGMEISKKPLAYSFFAFVDD
jgi:hypothetical protein